MTSPQSPKPRQPFGGSEVGHVDVGAYVLGVLDSAERVKFEEHLAGCPACRTDVRELGVLEPMLAELAEAGPVADPMPRPGEELLDRLVGEVAATRRRARRRRLVLVAAAAVLIVGGPAVTMALNDGGTPPAVVAVQQFSATDPASGASATVGVQPKAWGSQISLALSNVQGPLTCDLVAVSRTGERQTVSTWSVPAIGYTLNTTGSAGLAPSAIDHFEVRTLDGARLLVSIPAARAAT